MNPPPLYGRSSTYGGEIIREEGYDTAMERFPEDPASELHFGPPTPSLDPTVLDKLTRGLATCQDVAFVYLANVLVPSQQEAASQVLFVWLTRNALGSVRFALARVSQVVATCLPEGEFVDVVILNTDPELLEQVAAVGVVVVENSAEEHTQALTATTQPSADPAEPPQRWWWPFG